MPQVFQIKADEKETMDITQYNGYGDKHNEGQPVNMTGFALNEISAKALWQSFDAKDVSKNGDLEKYDRCKKFAASIGIAAGTSFCNKVMLMALNGYAGDSLYGQNFRGDNLKEDEPPTAILSIRDESKEHLTDKGFESFKSYVEGCIKDIVEKPLPELYYKRKFSMESGDLVEGMSNATRYSTNDTEMVVALNSIFPELGQNLFSEWIMKMQKIKEYPKVIEAINSLRKTIQAKLNIGNRTETLHITAEKKDYYFLDKGWKIITPAGKNAEIEHPDGGTMYVESENDKTFWVKSNGLTNIGVKEFDKVYDSFVQYIEDNTNMKYFNQ